MIACPKCGRRLKYQQVLKVHLFFKHPELSPSNPFLEKGSSRLEENDPKNNLRGKGLTPQELNQISEQVKQSTVKIVSVFKEQEAKIEKQKAEEKVFNEALGKLNNLRDVIPSHETKLVEMEKQVKSICEQYPGLCSKVEALEKKFRSTRSSKTCL